MTRMNNFHSSIGYTSVCVCVCVCVWSSIGRVDKGAHEQVVRCGTRVCVLYTVGEEKGGGKENDDILLTVLYDGDMMVI